MVALTVDFVDMVLFSGWFSARRFSWTRYGQFGPGGRCVTSLRSHKIVIGGFDGEQNFAGPVTNNRA
jgi:hypothetical protein